MARAAGRLPSSNKVNAPTPTAVRPPPWKANAAIVSGLLAAIAQKEGRENERRQMRVVCGRINCRVGING